MPEPILITTASKEDAGEVAALIARAFAPQLDVCRWLVPDADTSEAVHERYFRLYVDQALQEGTVYLAGDGQATAVWFPHRTIPAVPSPAQLAEHRDRLIDATGQWVDNFTHLESLFDDHHPAAPAHDHLAFLAVSPAAQGLGYGTALLAHHQRLLDADGAGGYLEASCPNSHRLYARMGWADHSQRIVLPDGTPMWPMWREPAPAAGEKAR